MLGIIPLSTAAAKTSRGPSTDKSVWISTAAGQYFDVEAVLRDHPLLKELYIPVFSLNPPLGTSSLQDPSEYWDRERGLYEECHARGISVYGIFSPLYYSGTPKSVPNSWFERDVESAFDAPLQFNMLTIYNPDTAHYVSSMLQKTLSSTKLDGIVIDLTNPAPDLWDYAVSDRTYMITSSGIDPVDVNYPGWLEIAPDPKDKMLNQFVQIRQSVLMSFQNKILDFALKHSSKVFLLGSGDLYQYPVTAQVAGACNWAQAISADPKLQLILTCETNSNWTAAALRTDLSELAKANWKGEIRLLTEQPDSLRSVVQEVENGKSVPAISEVTLLGANASKGADKGAYYPVKS